VTDDVIRSLIISQQLMGTTEVLIIEHTKCGLHGAREADIRGRAARMTGESPDAVDIVFGAFPDLEANLRDQVDRVRSDPYLKHVPVHGLIYDVTTGRLHEVV
jgi:carbonic anhydrase